MGPGRAVCPRCRLLRNARHHGHAVRSGSSRRDRRPGATVNVHTSVRQLDVSSLFVDILPDLPVPGLSKRQYVRNSGRRIDVFRCSSPGPPGLTEPPPGPGLVPGDSAVAAASPLPGSPDPVGVFFPVGDLTANMVVNPPTGKKSPRSFSHQPGTSPARSPRNPQIRPPHPAQARPLITRRRSGPSSSAPAHITRTRRGRRPRHPADASHVLAPASRQIPAQNTCLPVVWVVLCNLLERRRNGSASLRKRRAPV